MFTWTYIRSGLLNALIRVERGETGVLEDKVSGEAAFAGGSVAVTAPAPGVVKLLVKDWQSVRMGQPVAEVSRLGTAEAFEDSLAFARSRLTEYEASTDSEFAVLTTGIQSDYEMAVESFFSVRKAYAAGDVQAAQAEEKRLLDVEQGLLQKRERLMSMEDERARLEQGIAAIQAAQSSSTVQVLAPSSGVFSLDVTSVDAKMTAASLSSKDASELLALAREAGSARVQQVKDGQSVAAGDAIGRIVTGQGMAFFLPVKTEDRPDMKAGAEVTASIGSSSRTQAAVVTGVTDGKPPGYSIITGEIPMISADQVLRAGPLSLVTRSRSGIMVPASAVLEEAGQMGVLSVQKTYARFVPVEVLMTKGGKSIVRGISEGDEVVARAMKFLEGKRVR